MISRLACQTKIQKHNHKEGIECVPKLLLKRYHKTSKCLEIWHATCILSKQIKQTSWHPEIVSNMDIVLNNIYVYTISKLEDGKSVPG